MFLSKAAVVHELLRRFVVLHSPRTFVELIKASKGYDELERRFLANEISEVKLESKYFRLNQRQVVGFLSDNNDQKVSMYTEMEKLAN